MRCDICNKKKDKEGLKKQGGLDVCLRCEELLKMHNKKQEEVNGTKENY